MRRRLALSALALALLAPLVAAGAADRPELVEDALLPWSSDAPGFGSLSGLAISDDGGRIIAVSDKGHVITARLTRDAEGRLTDAEVETAGPLRDPDGQPVERYDVDAEGIARDPDGRLYVSFEANHRIWSYTRLDGPATALPKAAAFKDLQNNSGLEAIFTGPDGALYAIPERSGKLERPFPVWRYADDAWALAFSVPRRPPHLVTGADLGPDGRLYLLERHFSGLLGFSTRIRSFRIDANGLSDERILLESPVGRYDNMEGISTWRDAQGRVRLLVVSDDNENFLQRTELAEFIVTPPDPPRPYPRPR